MAAGERASREAIQDSARRPVPLSLDAYRVPPDTILSSLRLPISLDPSLTFT